MISCNKIKLNLSKSEDAYLTLDGRRWGLEEQNKAWVFQITTSRLEKDRKWDEEGVGDLEGWQTLGGRVGGKGKKKQELMW